MRVSIVVLATPTDALGCAGTPIEGLVEVVANPMAEALFEETCEGATIVPTGVAAGTQYSYQWSTSGNATVGQGASTATPAIENVACGDEVGLIVSKRSWWTGWSVECFSEQQTVALDVVALPQPELTTDSPLCNGADVVFDLIDVSDASGARMTPPSTHGPLTTDGASSRPKVAWVR